MAKRQIAIFVLGPSAMPTARKIKDAVGGLIHGPEGLEGADVTFREGDAGHGPRLHFREGRDRRMCRRNPDPRCCPAPEEQSPAKPLSLRWRKMAPALFRSPAVISGANDLARRIAAATDGHAAVTTASDVVFGEALDEPSGAVLANTDDHKAAAAARLRGEQVIRQDVTIHRSGKGRAAAPRLSSLCA
jgi:cobalt-precorrin 5A hydrolase/precorrin-3B C17-methyltransferase